MVAEPGVFELALVAILCERHILIEDVPGIGKTTLAKTLAHSLGCSFRRVYQAITTHFRPTEMSRAPPGRR